MASNRLYDLIIFGATGFTGKVAVVQLSKLLTENKHITWAVSGRSIAKLKDVLAEASSKSGQNLNDIPMVEADIKDEKSLAEMAAKAKVVVNCVGPYRFFGEAVVKACLDSGTHHVDISGEPQYMETMQLKYHKMAEEKGVYIISGCGFDSVPADLGLVHFIDQFQGDVNSVEAYVEYEAPKKFEGALINYGTYETVIHAMANMSEMKSLRRKLFSDPLPKLSPKLSARCIIHKGQVVNKWCIPFMGSDEPVMYRSQRYLYEHEHTRPVQVQTYLALTSFPRTLMVAFMSSLVAVMAQMPCTRYLLLKYPGFYTLGWVSREGPSEETMKNTTFAITFCGKGWSEKKPVEEGHSTSPNKTMITKVSGTDPAYGFTSKSLLLCALTILKESDKMPGNGGVLTTTAFAKTSLIKELASHGLKFEVIEQEEHEKSKST